MKNFILKISYRKKNQKKTITITDGISIIRLSFSRKIYHIMKKLKHF